MAKAAGNADVIELLEAYLDVARKNDFGHVAIAMVGHPNVAATDFAGDIALELSSRDALALLGKKLQTSIDNWTPPPRDETLGADYACYDMANGALGYDFLVWLVDAEMTRVREGAPAPLKVGFWLGADAQDRINRDRRRMWLEKLFRPLLPMIGAIEDSAALRGRASRVYVTNAIVAAVKRGEPVPRLRSGWPHKVEPAITITLREAAHWSHRNSNLEAWLRFASYLRDKGERVVFVRDTAKAYEPLGDFLTDPLASTHLPARVALYENAKANLFVSNGPGSLVWFGDRPSLMFVALEQDGSSYTPNTREFLVKSMGLEPGGQYPWSRPDQKFVWTVDTFENIMAAWEELAIP